LLALRAPRDEASLVIGLGQVLQGLPNAAAWLFDTRSHRVVWAVLAIGFGLAGSFLFLLHVTASRHAPFDLMVGVFFLVLGGLVPTAPLAALVLLALLVAMLAAMGISLTTGREAFMLPAATRVEAEPLPNARASDGVRRAEMDLEILYEARLVGLNHSLYDAGEVRDRIAIWLREQAGSSAPSC
jgi:hypothetical protein